MTQKIFEVQVNLWQRSLADCEYRDVVNAFEIWLNTEKYPPTLAEFKPVVIRVLKIQVQLFSPERPGREACHESQFGSMVRTIRNGLSKPFRNLFKRAVRNVGGWQKICQTELGREWDFLEKKFR